MDTGLISIGDGSERRKIFRPVRSLNRPWSACLPLRIPHAEPRLQWNPNVFRVRSHHRQLATSPAQSPLPPRLSNVRGVLYRLAVAKKKRTPACWAGWAAG
jgi:hypothetical protein